MVMVMDGDVENTNLSSKIICTFKIPLTVPVEVERYFSIVYLSMYKFLYHCENSLLFRNLKIHNNLLL